MVQRRWLLILGGVLLVSGLAVVSTVVFHWLAPPSGQGTQPHIGGAEVRKKIQVPNIPFKDVTAAAGIRWKHTNGATKSKLLPETMGSGVAFLDFDHDGFQDLLFVNSCEWPGGDKDSRPTLALYRNRGDGTFEDVTVAYGLDVTFFGMGVTVGDFDNDGFVDVFVTGVGEQHLFHNEGGKRFTDVTKEMGLDIGRLPNVSRADFMNWAEPIPFGSSATFIDFDGDGRLDLFVCEYVTWSPKIDLTIGSTLGGGGRSYAQPKEFEGALCHLYRNNGQRFEDVSAAAGVQVKEQEGTDANARQRRVGKSLGVVLCDADGDGWPDLIVANDSVRNFFFHNRPDPVLGRAFEEIGYPCGVAYAEGAARGAMGIDWGEHRPGKNAVIITNFANEPNTFLCLDRPNSLLFSDMALSTGLAGPSRALLKFGAFFFDCDLDGRLDLLTCNGHIEPEIATIQTGQQYAQPVQLFWNTGAAGATYEPVSPAEAGPDLFQPLVGRGCAFGDIDNNGSLDVVLTANGGEARLVRNDVLSASSNRESTDPKKPHWIRLVLEGDGLTSNRSAIGAQVTIEAGGRTMKRQVAAGRGYLSQSELPVTVGLGDAVKVDRVTVRWPGAKAGPPEVWTDLDADRIHPLRQGKSGTK